MTKKLTSKQLNNNKFLKIHDSTEIAGVLIGPSSNFNILGTWVRERDGEVVVAGIDHENGCLVGMIGSGTSGSIKNLTWVVVTELVTSHLLNLAMTQTPVGLLGKLTPYGEPVRECWITFQDEDLSCLIEAATSINNALE